MEWTKHTKHIEIAQKGFWTFVVAYGHGSEGYELSAWVNDNKVLHDKPYPTKDEAQAAIKTLLHGDWPGGKYRESIIFPWKDNVL